MKILPWFPDVSLSLKGTNFRGLGYWSDYTDAELWTAISHYVTDGFYSGEKAMVVKAGAEPDGVDRLTNLYKDTLGVDRAEMIGLLLAWAYSLADMDSYKAIVSQAKSSADADVINAQNEESGVDAPPPSTPTAARQDGDETSDDSSPPAPKSGIPTWVKIGGGIGLLALAGWYVRKKQRGY